MITIRNQYWKFGFFQKAFSKIQKMLLFPQFWSDVAG